jgi:CspA family cold shock protein
MSKGTVKFFNDTKGFGFITEEGVDKDHFVHVSGLVDEIREGDEVEFDLQEALVTVGCKVNSTRSKTK